jgi:hypothetical protein
LVARKDRRYNRQITTVENRSSKASASTASSAASRIGWLPSVTTTRHTFRKCQIAKLKFATRVNEKETQLRSVVGWAEYSKVAEDRNERGDSERAWSDSPVANDVQLDVSRWNCRIENDLVLTSARDGPVHRCVAFCSHNGFPQGHCAVNQHFVSQRRDRDCGKQVTCIKCFQKQ